MHAENSNISIEFTFEFVSERAQRTLRHWHLYIYTEPNYNYLFKIYT